MSFVQRVEVKQAAAGFADVFPAHLKARTDAAGFLAEPRSLRTVSNTFGWA